MNSYDLSPTSSFSATARLADLCLLTPGALLEPPVRRIVSAVILVSALPAILSASTMPGREQGARYLRQPFFYAGL